MIRLLSLLLLGLLPLLSLRAQTTNADTTIYQVAQEMPRFPGCENLDTTLVAKQQCAQQALLEFVYRRIIYPQEAREANIQGTAVVNFIVEKDGSISRPNIVRDPGGNIGLSVLRVLLDLQQSDIRFIPGRTNGKAVRTSFNLPVKFRIEEPKPYIMAGLDTIYVTFDSPLAFQGAGGSLEQFIVDELQYPAVGNDSCQIGQIDVRILVRPDGFVRVLDITDYNDLGFDFWYEAIRTVVNTSQQWKVATYEGRPVPAAIDISLSFMPTAPSCQARKTAYLAAVESARTGAEQYNNGEKEAGLAKMSAALEQFPDDGSLLLLRGQAYLDENRFPEACADLRKARDITLVDWFDSILPLICR